ncbi:MAG: hypothetical protein GYB68_06115, partial [Chloroflexi bacterium]|nr:hypothetical protein [Chloroflexota bacterium]
MENPQTNTGITQLHGPNLIGLRLVWVVFAIAALIVYGAALPVAFGER